MIISEAPSGAPSGAIWHIGMSGALYTADPGSIPDESNALFSEI